MKQFFVPLLSFIIFFCSLIPALERTLLNRRANKKTAFYGFNLISNTIQTIYSLIQLKTSGHGVLTDKLKAFVEVPYSRASLTGTMHALCSINN
jgi:hypothetical protein